MSILFAILLFSFLIFIHELGHFVAAKLSGVQVNEFAIFMGPALVKWQRGQTQYSIRCIPIGGFCAMEGEDEDTDNPRSFQKAAWWKRLVILLAGSAMNFVAGLLILAIVFAPAKQFVVPTIVSSEPGCTVVREDGLHVGDTFLEVDGEKIFVQSDVTTMLAMNPGDYHDIVVKRDGQKVVLDDFFMEKHPFDNPDGTRSVRYGINFGIENATFMSKCRYVWNVARNILRSVRLSLQMLFTGRAGLSDVSGPVGIVQIMSDTAQKSASALDAVMNMLYFGGFIATNLAAMNMLPLPALDGGRAFFLLLTTLIQAITKKKIDPKYEGYIHGAGMVLLLGLMAVVMFKDIFVIFKG